MDYKVSFPILSGERSTLVSANTRWSASMQAAKEFDLLGKEYPAVYIFNCASIERAVQKKPGRKKWTDAYMVKKEDGPGTSLLVV